MQASERKDQCRILNIKFSDYIGVWGRFRYPPKEAETKRLPCCEHACMSYAAVGEAGREKMETENLVSILKSERTFGYSSVCSVSTHRKIFFLWRPFLKDSKDDLVLELAVSSKCYSIITYNKKDFSRVQKHFGIQILTPKEFLKKIGEIK